MALWYFGVLLFTIFSGLYFINSGDRFMPNDNIRQNVAGLFHTCHEAAVAAALSDTTLGSAAQANLTCDYASLNNERAKGLDVPNLRIIVESTSAISPGAKGRVIVTYLPPGTATSTINDISFNEVLSQVQSFYSNDINTGIVVANDATSNKITQYTSVLVPTPLEADVGSIAMVTNIDSGGNTCPLGITMSSGGKCFKYFSGVIDQPVAEMNCAASASGGHLARIQTTADQNFVRTLIGSNSAWVDGGDQVTTNVYKYSDGTPMTYTSWNSGEPNHSPPSEHCIQMLGGSGGKWNDLTCVGWAPGFVNGYVCEY